MMTLSDALLHHPHLSKDTGSRLQMTCSQTKLTPDMCMALKFAISLHVAKLGKKGEEVFTCSLTANGSWKSF